MNLPAHGFELSPRTKPALIFSFVGTVLLGGLWVTATWLWRGHPEQALMRFTLFVAAMTAIHVIGFRLYRRQPIAWSPLYREATFVGIVLQALGLLFASLILMSGLIEVCSIAAGAYWITVGIIVSRRPETPRANDLMFIKYAFIPLCWIAMLMAIGIGRIR